MASSLTNSTPSAARRISATAPSSAPARWLAAASLLSLMGLSQMAQAADPPATTPAPAPAAKPAPAPAAVPAKVTLAYKAKEGQVSRAKGVITLNGAVGEQKIVIEQKDTGKVTYTKVEPNGNITYETTTESSDVLVNGQKPPADDDKPETETYTIRPNGTLVSYKTTKTDKDATHFAVRAFNASNPIFPDKALGVGDKWAQDFKSDDTLGTRTAHADYEITALEKAGDILVAKIKFAFAETGAKGISAKGTYTVEVASGDKVAGDYTMSNIAIGEPGQEQYFAGNIVEARFEGGPLPDSKNSADASKIAAKERTIDDVVKDYEKLPGVVTLYRKKENGRDSLYMEVRQDQLDKLMILQATASTGDAENIIPGDTISDTVFKMQKQGDDKITLVVPNSYYRANAKTPMGRAVRRSFPDAYLQTFKIEAKQADRNAYLIDVSDFFKSDFAQITQALAGFDLGLGPMSGGVSFMMDREKTYVDSVKNFPENLVIATQYHFSHNPKAPGGIGLADPRSLPLLVQYNLFALPNDPNTFAPTNGFQMRRADGRVGYFRTEYISFDDDNRRDQTERFIQKWDLRKKDPTAAVSEPVKPIVFWLDNAIPVEYRAAVKHGILAWNKAFERIGFKDAVQVNQMPDNADWDHADLRYNVVRWVVTPDNSPRNGVAIALFRANPLTGQILNASISIDAAWTRIGKLQRRETIDPATVFTKSAGPTDAEIARLSTPDAQKRLGNLGSKLNAAYCEVGGEGLREKAWFGDLALRLASPQGMSPAREKEYTDQLLSETVTHEMGHILGLTHNFIGSTELSLTQLANPAIVREHGISGSVMDYNNFNISAIKAKGVDFYSQAVGTYDNWAIAYGYSEFAPSDEAARLHQIAAQSNLPGHAYQADAEAMVGIDPRVVQYDMSADPLGYWERMLKLSRYLMTGLETREPKNGESYYEFTNAFYALLNTYSRAAGVASRYVGGIELNRNYKGDPKPKPTTESVSLAQQKQALNLLNTYVFSPSALKFPERYFSKMTTDPFGFSFSQDFPIEDQISGMQKAALNRLFSASVLRRVANSEFKKDGNSARALTLPTLFNSVSSNVWAEINTHQNVPTLRRQLQRQYLDTMIDIATKQASAPEDARMIAWNQLRTLKGKIAVAQTAPNLDEYTRLHLADSAAKITRTLNAQTTLGGQQNGGMNALLQMLMGKDGKAQSADPATTPAP